jgi:hypothetical protein
MRSRASGISGPKMKKSRFDRLWSKVAVGAPDECWPWLAKSKTKKGYGVMRGQDNKQTTAHRFAYESKYGQIPDGLMVLHSCDNPPCCNPSHLFLGTGTDNAADRDSKKRGTRPPLHKGESHPLAKLTKRQVDEIRQASGTLREISEQYGIGMSQVSAIRKGKGWK